MKADEIERGIREAFGPLARAAAAPLPDGAVPIHSGKLVSAIADPEVTSSSVQILHKRAAEPDDTVGDYRRSIVASLFAHAQRTLRRTGAQTRRQVPERWWRRWIAEPDRRQFGLSARVGTAASPTA